MPFHPHKEAACDMLGTAAAPQPDYQASRESELELIRVTNTLRELRSKFYTELDHVSATAAAAADICGQGLKHCPRV